MAEHSHDPVDLPAWAVAGADRWDQQIRFRDTLRANPELRDEYAAIKSRLSRTYADDREQYTDEKAVFVTRVIRDLDAAG